MPLITGPASFSTRVAICSGSVLGSGCGSCTAGLDGAVGALDVLLSLVAGAGFWLRSIFHKIIGLILFFNVVQDIKDFKEKAKKEIEKLTAMNVVRLEVVAKNIYVPGQDR